MRFPRRAVRTWAVAIVIVLIFSFLGRGLWKNWRQIPFEEIHFNYWLILLSYVCMFAFFLTYAAVWKLMLAAYGIRLSCARSFEILATSQLGKYIPGKVWFTVGRMYLAKQFDVPERVSIVSVVLETLLLAISAAMIGALTVAAPWNGSLSIRASVLTVAIILSGLVIVHPKIFGKLMDFVMKRLRRDKVEMSLTYSGIVGLLVLYCLSWFWQGTGFFLLVKSFYDVEIAMWPAFWGAYALAWMAGLLSLLTPAGLGVREGVMTFLISFYVQASVAVIIALVARVWSTIAEVMFFLVALPGMRKWRTLKPAGEKN